MRNPTQLDFKGYHHVNHLWSQLLERIGIERSKVAVSQALDLQSIYGDSYTIPALLVETCGIALVNIDELRCQTGLSCYGDRMILMLSTRQKLIQLLHEI